MIQRVLGTSIQNDYRLVAVLGFLGLAGFLVWMMVFGRFSDVDECWYKETGRQWAVNGRWAPPAIQGLLPDLEVPPEVVHFIQSPVYAFLFELFVKVAGFGWRQCVFFEVVIRLVMAVLVGRAVWKFGKSKVVGLFGRKCRSCPMRYRSGTSSAVPVGVGDRVAVQQGWHCLA